MAGSGDETAARADHGGSLVAARALFPDAPEPWIDLSTGINPHSYPYSPVLASAFSRLPEHEDVRRLAAAAASAYGAPAAANVVPAPGTQALLPHVFGLAPRGRAAVLGPTYNEHHRAAALVGHEVREVADPRALGDAELAVVVNPNNPDGRVIERDRLFALARDLRARGGLLVVDEAFMDVGPREHSLCGNVGEGGSVVLRSFGKFHGLAGVRLGFAVASEEIAERIAALLGPWAVSGPALAIGHEALADTQWASATRQTLAEAATRLDTLLARHSLTVEGGTSLFQLVRSADAPSLFNALGKSGIFARAFPDRPDILRFGLPAGDAAWRRLESALADWSGMGEKS